MEEGPRRGLELSTEHSGPRLGIAPGDSKCAVWCPPGSPIDEDPLKLGIRPVKDSGFLHLGAPVGSQVFVYSAVKKRVDKVSAILERLPALQNPHAEFVLLKSCFSLPKVSYIL